MAKQVQFRRGTTAQTATFTGAVAEVTVDTTKKVVVVHDGITAGGIPGAKQADVSAANVSIASLQANVGLLRIDVNALDPAGAASGQAQLRANIAAANVQIANLNANAVVQATAINLLNINLTGANSVATVFEVRLDAAELTVDQLQADIVAANSVIATVSGTTSANAAVQATAINLLNANVTAADINISTLQSNAAGQESKISLLNSNVSAANASILVNTNRVAAANIEISALQANILAANSAIAMNTNRVAAANIEISALQANITAANANAVINLDAVYSNLAIRTTAETDLHANVTAANSAIVTANTNMKGYVDGQITSLINNSPEALDTLKELSDALGADANFSTTITNLIAGVQSNVSAANAAILVNTNRVDAANAAIVNSNDRVDAANLRVNAANLSIALINSNLTAANSSISGLRANISAANVSITDLQSNIAAANTSIITANGYTTTLNLAMTANVTAANLEIVQLQANITAANAVIATVDLAGIGAINANVSAANASITAANAAIVALVSDITAANSAILVNTNRVEAANVEIASLRANVAANGFVFASNVNADNVNLTGNMILTSAGAPTVRFVRSPDTTVTAGEIYGNVDFVGEDANVSSTYGGVRARISTRATNSIGSAAINFHLGTTTTSGFPTFTTVAGPLGAAVLSVSATGVTATVLTVSTQLTSDSISTPNINNLSTISPAAVAGGGVDAKVNTLGSTISGYGMIVSLYSPYGSGVLRKELSSQFAMDATMTTANISLGLELNSIELTPILYPYGDTITNQLEISVTGTYVTDTGVSPPTLARLRKRIIATVALNSTTGIWTILDQQLTETVYNSDAINFAAGAVGAGKVFLQANATVGYQDLILRFDNRTTPAANSKTRWSYTITSTHIDALG